MEIDDHDFSVVRKNLNTFSVLILILAFSNARIDVTSLFGVTVTLNGQNFYVTLFVIYAYLAWRYLTKVPLMGQFWTSFMTYYLNSYGDSKMITTFIKYKDQFVTDPPENRSLLDNFNEFRLTRIMGARLQGRTVLQPRLILEAYILKPGSEMNGKNLSAYCDIEVGKWTFINKLVLFCTKYDKFGDYIFPIIPVVINASLFLFKNQWPGSLSRLMI